MKETPSKFLANRLPSCQSQTESTGSLDLSTDAFWQMCSLPWTLLSHLLSNILLPNNPISQDSTSRWQRGDSLYKNLPPSSLKRLQAPASIQKEFKSAGHPSFPHEVCQCNRSPSNKDILQCFAQRSKPMADVRSKVITIDFQPKAVRQQHWKCIPLKRLNDPTVMRLISSKTSDKQ